MRKKLWALLLVIALGTSMALTGCGKEESKPEASSESDGKIKCKIGYWGGTCEAPIYIAKEKGYFEKCGIDPQLFVITLDTTSLMASGDLDCYELTPDQFMPIKNGTEVKIIDSLHTGCIQGAASRKSGIKSVKDLEGKKVAAEQGGITQILLSSEMVKAGKDPKKVEWVTYQNSEKEQALNKGEIDAFVSFDPFAEIAENNGNVKFFSNTFDKGLNDTLCCFVGLNTRKLEENPDLAGRLSKAFKMACDDIQSDPEAAAKLIMEKEYIAGDAAVNAKLIEDYTWIAGDKDLLYKSAKEIWHQVYRAGALDEEVAEKDLDSWIDKMVDTMVVYKGQ